MLIARQKLSIKANALSKFRKVGETWAKKKAMLLSPSAEDTPLIAVLSVLEGTICKKKLCKSRSAVSVHVGIRYGMAQLFSGERWFSTAKILTESVPCILIHSPISIVHLVTVSALSERKQQNFSHIFHRALHPLLSLSSISDLSPSLVLPCEEIILNWLKINHLVYQTSPQTLQVPE
ncbi:hypothetical protein KEM48_001663 [Puccinia striiformis f. sp. tritici PST-130]|nr:hypothetical protein KEM48_001663 [Puccinia striiformis f. sp. tritici PST-130]